MEKESGNAKQDEFAGVIRNTQLCRNGSAKFGLQMFFVGQCGFEFTDDFVPEAKGPGSEPCGLEVEGLI
jgi:hypothetical protein